MVPLGENHTIKDRESGTTLADRNLNTEPLWTVDDVAAYLRLEQETVRTMTRNGDLPGFKVGRMWRYRHKDIKIWLQKKGE
ncbi:helix-turn-helix domain-containing protein [Chloroflexota bacterium]